ncbi:restriction endonuclease subunit S [Streptomyces sp. CB09001]|uniref:restriction endonuclease subunit S n=1 Tax=Streptomyces sp. CB09001 TaxID=2083284 RepID=UPI000E29EB7D|nr:restriction endonuclease subunit S [Streptomyces sp. CB09001]AXL90775.1 restriction endonuclease subunit S [Streptomyces sp. CB09001]
MSENGDVSGGRELPTGWAWSILQDLLACEPRAITDGPFGSNLKSAHYTASGARVIRLQNVGDGEFRDERAYISLEHFESLRAHEAIEGDLLLASLGETLPRVAIVPKLDDPAIVKADVIRARLHPGVLTKWVYYALLAPQTRAYAGSLIKGVGRPRLGMAAMRDIPVPLPPLAEQHRIVEALEEQLSRIDSGGATLRQARRRLEGLRKRVLVSTVPDEVPESWRMTTVEGAGTLELGRARHPDWHHGPDVRPYLRVANVFEDRIDTTDVMEMDFSGIWERYRLESGDVLLNEGQSPHLVGRPALYRGIPENVAFTNSLLRFKANADVLPEWALLVFRRHLHAKRFMREVRITTNIAHLSAKRLKKVEFPVPPLEVQKQLVQRCDELLTGIAAMDRQVGIGLRRGNALRAALLRRAFTGGLGSQDPAEEPAAVLLDRIAAERAATPKPKPKRTRKATTKASSQRAADVAAPEPTSSPALAVQQEFEL